MTAAPASLADVHAYVDANTDRFLEELLELLRIRSVATDAGEVARAAESVREHLARVGLDARLMASSGNPMVYGEKRATVPGAPTVLLYGHYDVMPAGDAAEWRCDPFEPVIRDGRIWGRGVGDNKGQHFAHVKALEALGACGVPTPTIRFLVEGEEETGSASLAPFVREHREMLAADLCFAADGPRHESDRPTVYLGCRGVVGMELTVRGAARDLHSGNRGNLVPNAGWRLAQALAGLVDEHGLVCFEGCDDGVRPMSAAEREHVAGLPFDGAALAAELGVPGLAELDAAEYYRRLMFSPCLSVNGIVCGHTGPGGKTVIPARGTVKMDLRLVADQQPETVVAHLRHHLDRHGFADVEVAVNEVMRPSRTPLDHPWVPRVVGALAEASGETPVVWPSLGGSIPQHAFVDGLGVPCVWSAYANWDEANHAPDENLRVDLFVQAVKMSATLFARLAEGGVPTADA